MEGFNLRAAREKSSWTTQDPVDGHHIVHVEMTAGATLKDYLPTVGESSINEGNLYTKKEISYAR